MAVNCGLPQLTAGRWPLIGNQDGNSNRSYHRSGESSWRGIPARASLTMRTLVGACGGVSSGDVAPRVSGCGYVLRGVIQRPRIGRRAEIQDPVGATLLHPFGV